MNRVIFRYWNFFDEQATKKPIKLRKKKVGLMMIFITWREHPIVPIKYAFKIC